MKKTVESIRNIKLLILLLVSLAAGFGLLRLVLVDPNAFPAGDSLWKLSLDIDVTNPDERATLLVPYPTETSRIRIVRQSLSHPGIVLTRLRKQRFLTPLHQQGHC